MYRRLVAARGPLGWWPGGGPFEVCVGAVLVQNTAWVNVEKALGVLRRRRALSFGRLHALGPHGVAPLIRSSGTYNVKARRLAALLDFLQREYGGRVGAMAAEKPLALRRKLLAVPGIGRETADSIVLYAAGLPLFVVDAYTRRVFFRLGLLRGDESYDAVQAFFMERLPRDAALFNDYHAQIVLLAQDTCRSRLPRCAACPLEPVCRKRGVESPRRARTA